MLTYELDKMSKEAVGAVLERTEVDLSEATDVARGIISDVRRRGDGALLEYARKLDGLSDKPKLVPREEIEAAFERAPRSLVEALVSSKNRIEHYHSKQRLLPFEFKDPCGVFGQRVVPLDRVGVYVPGGTASYASSVLMTCVPARIAGVREIALFTPGRDGAVNDNILAAAFICGVEEVYRIGGAQAIAAMAYGTQTVQKVQKIVGPGGAVVSAAKLLVRNDCEIDMLAGPSEVLIVADARADPQLTALEMLAQLEHDRFARAVLVTPSRRLIEMASASLSELLKVAERRGIASAAAKKGAIFLRSKSIGAALEFSNMYAPEHLLIDVEDPRPLLDRVENAGSVFVGRSSSVAFGDYCSGTNHVLPTKGRASMKSALSTYDFVKIIPYQSISATGARKLAPTVTEVALSEGLPAHALSAQSRAKGSIE
jgi:histidinol dehydrogenase